MKDRFAVFGDVHGELEPLRAAIAQARQRADVIVGLGDYVNRGPSTFGVLDLILGLSNQPDSNHLFLKGNHEVELLRFLESGDLSRFAAFGGLQTIGAYVDPVKGNVVAEFQRVFPESHRQLLRSMPSYYETENYLFSHAGFDPADPGNRDDRSMVMGSNRELFSWRGPWPQNLVVSGHYPQRNGKPYSNGNFFSIDTGCGTFPEGRLTLLYLPSRTIAQFGTTDG